MAKNTYVALQNQTFATAASSITLSSIPQDYTDLVLVVNCGFDAIGSSFVFQFNGVTTYTYSYTYFAAGIYGLTSGRNSFLGINAYNDSGGSDLGLKSNVILSLQNYSNTTTFKTCIFRGNTDLEVAGTVGLFRNTDAVTSISVSMPYGGNIQAGTTLSLYGIKAE
jgi:hypothetical protein